MQYLTDHLIDIAHDNLLGPMYDGTQLQVRNYLLAGSYAIAIIMHCFMFSFIFLSRPHTALYCFLSFAHLVYRKRPNRGESH
jgi:hypothetical protein